MLENFMLLDNHKGFIQLLKEIDQGVKSFGLTGLNQIHKVDLVLTLWKKTKKPILIITEDDTQALAFTEALQDCSSPQIARQFVSRDFVFYPVQGGSMEYEQKRISTIAEILYNNTPIIVTSPMALLQNTMKKEVFLRHTLSLSLGDEMNLDTLLSSLALSGYQRKPEVHGTHQFALRGGILDVFPSGEENPIRIEFFGDEIDSIATFSLDTQRRDKELSHILIPPALEVILEDFSQLGKSLQAYIATNRHTLPELLIQQIEGDILLLQEGNPPQHRDAYLPFLSSTCPTLLDYFPHALPIFIEPNQIEVKYKNFLTLFYEECASLEKQGIITSLIHAYYLDLSHLLQFPTIISMDTFTRSNPLFSPHSLLDFGGIALGGWNGFLEALLEDLTGYLQKKYHILLYCGEEKFLRQTQKDLEAKGISTQIQKDDFTLSSQHLTLTTGTIASGFTYKDYPYLVLSLEKIRVKNKGKKPKKRKNPISSLEDIHFGDLLVHSTHGIGRFEGIQNITIQGMQKDYIKIKYKGADTLYLPVTQLDLVSKYIGNKEDGTVRLNRLHSEEWKKTKTKVYTAIQDMAKELLALYAKRQQEKGFSFSPDTPWQGEFEERFPYEETGDQLQSIAEIKKDMEKPIPMERLLCGDVGFGKTEVALRAAFKCIMDGKQVALLVPTTILAWQHYQTVVNRMAGFPIEVALLSRFKSPKEQKQVIKELESGKIDMVIGTHRIIQKDVKFRELGLAIIDEEQRFGVGDKEKFKTSFTAVDQLTLSATPIPRTLNMAMSGIRDMSLLEDPPINRQPVQTYVLEEDWVMITQAIEKELRREGQIYYIHNRIDSMEKVQSILLSYLPDLRISIAHGKMKENELSRIWKSLVDKEIDLLLCTTIIETGVDVPNCNTLIVDNADHMGLSQLYQLRGRVGRSHKRGFCYFTFSRGKVLSELSAKRLSAIKEFTSFGSGFKLAMRDLEIRGAGNLLSKNQHGHLESVGYDMYMRLLNHAVAQEKGEISPSLEGLEMKDCFIDLAMDAYIPEDYIPAISTRIDVYKKIAQIATKEEWMDAMDELIDRFGPPPKAVQGLLDISFMRNRAMAANIYEIKEKDNNLLLYASFLDMESITRVIHLFSLGKVFINASHHPYISIQMKKGVSPLAALQEFFTLFHQKE